jgi:EmrB/QacA subfamily drug resistance transporter
MSFASQLRRHDASAPLILVIVCAGVVLASLDLFVVNLALPSLARDLHEHSLAKLSWVLNAFAIVSAAALLPLGRLADRHRAESGFLAGVALFTAASAACGLASSLTALVIFRIVQALGAALLTPTSLRLLLATSAPKRRAASVRTWTAAGGFAAGLGPVVGGLLVPLGWRWVFFVNVPIGLAALIAGFRHLPEVPGRDLPRPDLLGATLATAGVGLLTLGLVEGNDWRWGSPRIVAALALAVLLLAASVLHTLTHRNPLIDPALFRRRAFSGSGVVALLFSVAFGAMVLSIVLWMQDVWGWSALRAGMAFAPGPLMVPAIALLLSGRLIKRFGPGRVIAAGATVYAIGIAWWAVRAGLRPDYLGQVLPGTLLTGTGVGLTMPTFMSTGASALPPQAFATGSAALNMLRQVGLAIGVAVFVALLGSPAGATAALTAYRNAWWAIAAVALAAALAGAATLRGCREPQGTAAGVGSRGAIVSREDRAAT